ncbi:MAG: FAD-binding oxidoreductase [Candidatus Tectimicrobiota bacterium]
MAEHVVLQALRTLLDPAKVSIDHVLCEVLARDALHPGRLPGWAVAEPLGIVRPADTTEVAAVLRLARQYRVPVVPIGGGSGLMGGAASLTPGLVLDLRGLQEVHIRPLDRMAEVGAGVTIQTLNEAAAPYGLMCAHDPWTVAVATVGGTIATDSLGYLGGKYGSMGDQVLGVEVVLPDGEIVTTRAVEKASTGPRLHRLFVGAEGCFGIVTRATLRLFPVPQERLLLGWEFPSFAAGFAALNALLQVGLRPGLLEYCDERPGVHVVSPATLLMSCEGPRRVAQAEAEEARSICVSYGAAPLPQAEVTAFWEERHTSGDAYAAARAAGTPWRRYGQRPPLDYLHVALPPSAVLAYRQYCLETLEQAGLETLETGLWGHAGLFNLVFTGSDGAQLAAVQPQLLQRCQELNGAMEYCHGVGVRLAPLMAREHGSGLALLRRLKQCLDPDAMLNPGKLALDMPPA